MADEPTTSPATTEPPSAAPRRRRAFFALRREVPRWQALLLGVICVALCYGLWWFVTREDAGGDRIISRFALTSPSETFGEFRSLWFERALTLNTLASLRRVSLGFLLAAVIGVPVGLLCGCFPWFNSFLAPVTIFGRNIPLAALVALTFALFGTDEAQKVMFIFIASVAFIVIDTATAVINVSDRYIDTAYTLGASRRQIIVKVLLPLALPGIFDSLRLLFGLAFGYVMLAELVQTAGEYPGLGGIINTSQHQGPREHIALILIIIPIVALVIDRGLFWIQRQLFPYRYGGGGLLHQAVRASLRTWEDFTSFFLRSRRAPRPGVTIRRSGGQIVDTSPKR